MSLSLSSPIRLSVCVLAVAWTSSAALAHAEDAKPGDPKLQEAKPPTIKPQEAPKPPEPTSESKPPELVAERNGVVVVEQAGRVLGLGIILNGDGRVLTAASRLPKPKVGTLVLRYSDGKTREARLGHLDPERDLALLVPKTLAVQSGVKAPGSILPSSGATLRALSLGASARTLSTAQYSVKSLEQSSGKLLMALEPPAKATDLGSPLFDAHGQTVGVLVSGCSGPPSAPSAAAPCTLPPVGLPVSTVRAFLRALPSTAEPSQAWLGIDGISADTGIARGIRIGHIEPKSPASSLPLRVSTDASPGDVLVAIAGKPVPTLDALSRALTRHAAGERVELLVLTPDGFHTHSVRLAERPAKTP